MLLNRRTALPLTRCGRASSVLERWPHRAHPLSQCQLLYRRCIIAITEQLCRLGSLPRWATQLNSSTNDAVPHALAAKYYPTLAAGQPWCTGVFHPDYTNLALTAACGHRRAPLIDVLPSMPDCGPGWQADGSCNGRTLLFGANHYSRAASSDPVNAAHAMSAFKERRTGVAEAAPTGI